MSDTTLQQTQQAQQFVFEQKQQTETVQKTRVTTAEERKSYEVQTSALLEEFEKQQQHRLKMRLSGKDPAPEEEPPIRKVRIMEPIPEPELGLKAKGKQYLQKTFGLRRGRKLTRDATPYTSDMLKEDANIMKERRKWETEQDQDKVKTHDDELAAALKDEVLNTKYNSYMFDKEYFGKNFLTVRTQIENLRNFLRLYGPGGARFGELKPEEKSRITVLPETLKRMEICFRYTAELHGCELKKDGSLQAAKEKTDTVKEQDKVNHEMAVKSLKSYLEDDEAMVMDAMQENCREAIEQKTEEIRQEEAELREANQTENPELAGIYATDFQYQEIANMKKWIADPKNKERYEANKEVVDSLLEEYINMVAAQTDIIYQQKAAQFLVDDLVEKNAGKSQTEWSEDAMALRDLYSEQGEIIYNKLSLYNNRLISQQQAIRHLLRGSTDIDDGAWQILKENKISSADAHFKDKGTLATLYADDFAEKTKLYKDTIRKKFEAEKEKNPNVKVDELVERYSTGTLGRAVMLMKGDDPAYNMKVVNLQVSRDMSDNNLGDEALKKTVAKEAEEIVIPKLTQVINFDMSSLDGLDDQALAQKQTEVFEVIMAGMMTSDLGKLQSDIPNFTIKDKMLGRPRSQDFEDQGEYAEKLNLFLAKSDAFKAKMTILESFKLRTRAAGILEGIGSGALDDPYSVLTAPEIAKVKQRYPEATPEDQVILFARDMQELADRQQEANEEALLSSETVKNVVGEGDPGEPREAKLKRYYSVLGGNDAQ